MKSDKYNTLTLERLKALLRYDPLTGIWRWVMPRPKCSPGAIAGSRPNPDGYMLIKVDGNLYLAHVLAWFYMTGEWPTGEIDHRDKDGSHNWWSNLRPATSTQNKANASPRYSSRSGYKGVYYHAATGKWRARVQKNKLQVHIGLFDDPAAAAAAYDAAAVAYFGEFASLNFPPPQEAMS